MRLFTAAALGTFLCSAVMAKTLHVSPTGTGTDGLSWETAFTTVHAAMVATSSGDHVWVRSATYAGNIQMTTGVSLFGGFAGTESLAEFHVRDWEANPTVLSGGGPVLQAADQTFIDGFAIQDGVSAFPEGGGVFIHSAICTMQHCKIHLNRIAGVKCLKATVDIQSCIVTENDGGGIDITDSTISIQNCKVMNNTAGEGAGLEVRGSSLDMRGCWILENLAESNAAVARGGGIYSYGTKLILDRCVIARNVARGNPFVLGSGSDGGAIYSLADVDATLTNCLIDGNVANDGMAFSIGQDCVFTTDGCTLVRQMGEVDGGTVINTGGGNFVKLMMSNSIMYLNEGLNFLGQNNPRRKIRYSNIEQGGEPGEGNIDADPLFVDPANGDFRLQSGSPCIDSASMNGPTTDLDGNARPSDVPGVGREGPGAFDMGTYEFVLPTPAPTLVNDRSDINRSGEVNSLDLLILLADWKKVTGA